MTPCRFHRCSRKWSAANASVPAWKTRTSRANQTRLRISMPTWRHHLFAQARVRLNIGKTRMWNFCSDLPRIPQPCFSAVVLPALPDLEVAVLHLPQGPIGAPCRWPKQPCLPKGMVIAALLGAEQGEETPLPDACAERARLALFHGGLRLRRAFDLAPAAYFASWADVLGPMSARDPGVGAALSLQDRPVPWMAVSGPFAARVFTALPTLPCAWIPPPSVRYCCDACCLSHLKQRYAGVRRPLYACGDHRAACARSGLLRLRGAVVGAGRCQGLP